MEQNQQQGRSVFREAHLRDYWKVAWQGRWTVLAVFVLVVGATAVYTFLQTPIYRATATIEIQPQARRLMTGQDASGLGAAGYGWFAEEKYHNTQVEILKSRDVAQRVVQSLGLDTHPAFAKAPDPVQAFRGRVGVEPRRETGLIEVSILGRDPAEITQWVNEVARQYVDRNIDNARDNARAAMTAIKEQMQDMQADLSTAEQSRIEVLQDEEIFNSENQQEIINQRLQSYHKELDDVTLELSHVEDSLAQIRAVRAEGSDPLGLPELAADTTLQEINRSRIELLREIDGMQVELRPGHPDVARKQGELDSIQQRMADRVALLVGSLRDRYDLLADKADFLEEQIRVAEQDSLRVAKATSKYEIVRTDAETKKNIFDLIAKTTQEIQLNLQLMNNNVSVLDEAAIPLFPIKPRKTLNLGLGAVMGLLLGVAAVFFLDYLDNTIRTPEDVEKFLGLSVLGVVPKMGDEGLAQRAVKEAYQSLRTSIIFSSKNRQRKVVLITSTGPREGKSSTVANLARTLAAAGDRVIVIDCDLRKPKQHLHHGVPRDPGLTNYLAAPAEDLNWGQYVQTAEKVDLLCCGPIPPSPPELLSNERFAHMLTAMRDRYDWILIDSPPAATLADAALLASLADMIVAVVQHNRTDRDMVVKTLHQLRSSNAPIAGVVLNNVDLDRAYHKDYYYAGYYYEEDDTSRRSRRRKIKEREEMERRVKVG